MNEQKEESHHHIIILILSNYNIAVVLLNVNNFAFQSEKTADVQNASVYWNVGKNRELFSHSDEAAATVSGWSQMSGGIWTGIVNMRVVGTLVSLVQRFSGRGSLGCCS